MYHGGPGHDPANRPPASSQSAPSQHQTQAPAPNHGFALPHERREQQQLQQQQQQQQQQAQQQHQAQQHQRAYQPFPQRGVDAPLPVFAQVTNAPRPSMGFVPSLGAGQSTIRDLGHPYQVTEQSHPYQPRVAPPPPVNTYTAPYMTQPTIQPQTYAVQHPQTYQPMPVQNHFNQIQNGPQKPIETRPYQPPQPYTMPQPYQLMQSPTHVDPVTHENGVIPATILQATGMPQEPPAPKVPRRPTAVHVPPPDHSLLLGYDTKALQWNATRTLNDQHKYCYCGEDRNLLDLDVNCWKCKNFFHGRCIRINMGPVVPFMTNYSFTCKHCSSEGVEDFKRLTASWKSVAATTLANLLLMRIRASNPDWEKHHFGAVHVETLSQAEGWFLRKTDMIPFLTIPRHWAAIASDRPIDMTWQSPLGVALSGTKEIFRCFDEENRSANAHYTLADANLFLFKANYVQMLTKPPGTVRKRKAEVLESGQDGQPGTLPTTEASTATAEMIAPEVPIKTESAKQPESTVPDVPLFNTTVPVKAGHVMPKEDAFIIPPERVSARASKPVLSNEPSAASTPQKPTVERSADGTPAAPDGPRERKPTAKKAAASAPRKDLTAVANGNAHQEGVPRGNAILLDSAGALRLRPPPYKPGDLNAPQRLPTRVPVDHAGADAFYAFGDLPFNKRGFRYTTCAAAPDLPSLMYRSVELPPHAARIDWSDMSQYVYLSRDALSATTDKGFRTARANVGVREGSWYWEVQVLCGNGDQGGHVRLGVARREATLDAPVGFDGYGYGLRDRGGEKMHLSRPRPFMKDSFGTGDVIGFHLQLPAVPSCAAATARVAATAKPRPKMASKKKQGGPHAGSGGPHAQGNTVPQPVRGAGGVAGLVARERIPIRYRGQMYFEQLEYVGTREMEDRLNPGAAAAAALASAGKQGGSGASKTDKVPGTLQDPEAILKGSSLTVYKNGKRMGIAFQDLLNFLPPFSQTSATQALAASSGNVMPQGTALTAADDGTLGYYPAVSVFSGGAARFNFGPDFTHPPQMKVAVRPMSERYAEQIAEDIVWDLMDEVEFELLDEAMGYTAPHAVVGAGQRLGSGLEREATGTPVPEGLVKMDETA